MLDGMLLEVTLSELMSWPLYCSDATTWGSSAPSLFLASSWHPCRYPRQLPASVSPSGACSWPSILEGLILTAVPVVLLRNLGSDQSKQKSNRAPSLLLHSALLQFRLLRPRTAAASCCLSSLSSQPSHIC